MEFVVCAVIRCRVTGEIYRGNCHAEAREEAMKAFLGRQGLDYDEVYADQNLYMSFLNQWIEEQIPLEENEGFATNKREFISRDVAYFVALNNGRVGPANTERLDSEDL